MRRASRKPRVVMSAQRAPRRSMTALVAMVVPWMMASGTDTEATYLIDGVAVRNGKANADTYGSKELIANSQACAHPDEAVLALRQEIDGRIVG